MWVLQAKALLKLLDGDLEQFVIKLLRVQLPNTLGKRKNYSDDLQIDFGFMDKVLTHMVGLNK